MEDEQMAVHAVNLFYKIQILRMNNHLNILPKHASFDLKCSNFRLRLRLRPNPRRPGGAYDKQVES